ncbi:MAG: hypothetical protein ACRCZK_07395 [Oscillospiraceae bacterium]
MKEILNLSQKNKVLAGYYVGYQVNGYFGVITLVLDFGNKYS